MTLLLAVARLISRIRTRRPPNPMGLTHWDGRGAVIMRQVPDDEGDAW